MKYPIIPDSSIQAVTRGLIDGAGIDFGNFVTAAGRGDDLTLPDLSVLSATLRLKLDEFVKGPEAKDQDRFEGSSSPTIHSAFSDLPTMVLDDPGFWAFLSLRHFWWLVHWREAGAFKNEPSDYLRYVDGKNQAECVILRMFLRGQIALAGGGYDKAYSAPQATDFWRSHLVRVSTGAMPEVAGALIDEHASQRLVTDELRPFARRLNRMSTNLVREIYDADEAKELIKEIRG